MSASRARDRAVRAVVYSGYRMTPTLRQVPDPACPGEGVVLAVGASGVCRSDWHAWRGHEPVVLPHIPGHELAGVVAEVGSGVTRWRVGDRVTVPFVCGCGGCEFCRAGDAQVCPHQTQPGFTGLGSFAERVAIHAADVNLVPLPDSVDFIAAASLGCRFATAFRALTAHGRLGPGDWLAVHGCGGVGLSAVMIAKALEARVVAVDVADAALDRARDLGAEAVVDAGRDLDPAATIREITHGGARGVRRCAGLAGHRGGLGVLPSPPRPAHAGWSATRLRRHATDSDGPGHRAGTGDLRLAWNGGPRVPADAGAGRQRHPSPGPAARRGNQARGGRKGAGRDGPTVAVGRDDGDRAAAMSWRALIGRRVV